MFIKRIEIVGYQIEITNGVTETYLSWEEACDRNLDIEMAKLHRKLIVHFGFHMEENAMTLIKYYPNEVMKLLQKHIWDKANPK